MDTISTTTSSTSNANESEQVQPEEIDEHHYTNTTTISSSDDDDLPVTPIKRCRKRQPKYESSSSTSSPSFSSEELIIGYEMISTQYISADPMTTYGELVRTVKGRPSEIEAEAANFRTVDHPCGGVTLWATYPAWLAERRGADFAVYKIHPPLPTTMRDSYLASVAPLALSPPHQ